MVGEADLMSGVDGLLFVLFAGYSSSWRISRSVNHKMARTLGEWVPSCGHLVELCGNYGHIAMNIIIH